MTQDEKAVRGTTKNDVAATKKSTKRFRGKKGFKKPEASNSDVKPGNDFQFWNEYPELMSIASRFPWMHIQGTPLAGTNFAVDLPNVAIQHYHPIPGIQNSAVSPLNMAFRQMYLDMHRKYRGIGAYQASDIAITVLCIESALQLIVEAERVYGILNTIPIKSRIQPEGLLFALGYTFQFVNDVKIHMADFRYGINRLINLARRLPLPSGMNFCADHLSLNAFLYADSKDERAGVLAFAFDGYFAYHTTNMARCINNAGTAAYIPFARSSFATGDALLQYIDNVLYNLLYDSDILRITSDFIACYGEENMQVLMPLDENYIVLPTYNESILSKWHNSERVVGNYKLAYRLATASTTQITPNTSGLFCVYQENDTVYSLPTLYKGNNVSDLAWDAIKGILADANYSYEYNLDTHLVDTWMSEPDEATACESLLWKGVVVEETNTGNNKKAGILSHISDVVMGVLEVKRVRSAAVMGTLVYELTDNALNTDIVQDGLIQFDWHPEVYSFTGNVVTSIMGDLDNCSLVTNDTIDKVLDAALLSAFKVKSNLSGGSQS